MAQQYFNVDGLGGWFLEQSTGDVCLLINNTVVHRITSASVVTVGTLTGTTVSTSGATTTTSNVGAIGTDGTLVTEGGNSAVHVTTLTFTKSATVAAAALSWGAECYTLPAVPCTILGASVDGYVQSTGAGGAVSDVGEVGLGILAGTGANATLAAVDATAENIITGTAHTAVAADTSGVADIVSGPTLLPTTVGASAVIYANIAGTWTAADDVAFVGTLKFAWMPLV